jgi:hypothetical protein
MNDIGKALLELGREIDFPPTPDLVVGAELARARHRRLRRLRALALVVAVAVATAISLALSPGARSAFRELFGIGGVEIRLLEEAPQPTAARIVPFGRPVTLARAASAVPFRIRVPTGDVAAPPARVYLDRAGGGIVSLVWCCEPRVVLTELPGSDPGLLQKTIGPSTLVEPIDVAGAEGLWVEGADHVLRVVAPTGAWSERPIRVHGGVLLWTSGDVTFRLDGDLTRADALALAERIR